MPGAPVEDRANGKEPELQTVQENEPQHTTKTVETAKEQGQTSTSPKCTFSRTVIPIDLKRFMASSVSVVECPRCGRTRSLSPVKGVIRFPHTHANGFKLYCEASGQGVPVVFIHGGFPTLATTLNTIRLQSATFLFPLYLQQNLGQDALQAGIMLLPFAVASGVSSLIGGRLVDRLGARVVILLGSVLLIVCTWQLTFIALNSPVWWLQLLFIGQGAALGLCYQPLIVTATAEIPPQRMVLATTINTLTRACELLLASFGRREEGKSFQRTGGKMTSGPLI